MVSQATSEAAKLSTRAVGSVIEVGGPVTSVADVKGKCLDCQLEQGLPGGEVGVMSKQDESSRDEINQLAAAGLGTSVGKSCIHADICHQVLRPALMTKAVSATSQGKEVVGDLKADATERVWKRLNTVACFNVNHLPGLLLMVHHAPGILLVHLPPLYLRHLSGERGLLPPE